MVRIYFSLALLSSILLVAALALGLRIGDLQTASQMLLDKRSELRKMEQARKSSAADVEAFRREVGEASKEFRPFRQRQTLHMLTGLAAALATVLVNSITVTYFIGTNRWCKEVSETYRMPDDLARRSHRLKSAAFPWSLLGILSVMGIAMLGAASDPGAALKWGDGMATAHYMAAVLGTLLVIYSFYQQLQYIRRNYEVIDAIMQYVGQRRAEQGLGES